jgi:hypothetical protein
MDVTFTTEPPKAPEVPTVRVTARDVKTGKSKTTTIYNVTPEGFISAVEEIGEMNNQQQPHNAANGN